MARRRLRFALGLALLPATAGWAQVPLGPEFRSNSYTTGVQDRASVASDAAGNFVVTWHGGPFQAFTSYDIFGGRFDPSGAAIDASDLPINDITANAQGLPSVGSHSSGRFVVTWVSPDAAGYGVSARRYDAAGVPQGDEFRVNTYTTDWQQDPAVAVAGDGSFVVVWRSAGQDGSGDGVFGQRHDAQGGAQGSEFRVNTYTTGSQRAPDVAVDGNGGFVVVWQSTGQGGPFAGVFAQRYDAAGTPQGGELVVSSHTESGQYAVDVASDAAGNFVVAWSSRGQDGDNWGVFHRRFAPDVIFKNGFESDEVAASDEFESRPLG